MDSSEKVPEFLCGGHTGSHLGRAGHLGGLVLIAGTQVLISCLFGVLWRIMGTGGLVFWLYLHNTLLCRLMLIGGCFGGLFCNKTYRARPPFLCGLSIDGEADLLLFLPSLGLILLTSGELY